MKFRSIKPKLDYNKITESEWAEIQNKIVEGEVIFSSTLKRNNVEIKDWQKTLNSYPLLIFKFQIEYDENQQPSDMEDEALDTLYFLLFSAARIRTKFSEEIDPHFLFFLYNECEKFLVANRLLEQDRPGLRPALSRKIMSHVKETERSNGGIDRIVSTQNLIRDLTVEYGFDPFLAIKVIEELGRLGSLQQEALLKSIKRVDLAFVGSQPVEVKLPKGFGAEDVFIFNVVRLFEIGLGYSKKEAIRCLESWMTLREHHTSDYSSVIRRLNRLEKLDRNLKSRFSSTYLPVIRKISKSIKPKSLQRLEVHLQTNRKAKP
jgi:hypothetical protein